MKIKNETKENSGFAEHSLTCTGRSSPPPPTPASPVASSRLVSPCQVKATPAQQLTPAGRGDGGIIKRPFLPEKDERRWWKGGTAEEERTREIREEDAEWEKDEEQRAATVLMKESQTSRPEGRKQSRMGFFSARLRLQEPHVTLHFTPSRLFISSLAPGRCCRG